MCVYKTEDGKCKKFSNDKITSYCVNAPCEHEKQTNYDRIRNMSVEKLARFMNECGWDFPPYCSHDKSMSCDQNCLMCAKEYLESEVTE